MRIDELKRIAKENGYGYAKSFGEHNLLCEDNCNSITINEDYINIIFIKNEICRPNDMSMIKAAVEFAETPPDEREEEKKYRYKHDSLRTKGGNWSYLAIRQRPSMSYPILQGSDIDIFEYKVEFTDKEIEGFKKEFNIKLDNFIKEDVEND